MDSSSSARDFEGEKSRAVLSLCGVLYESPGFLSYNLRFKLCPKANFAD